MNWMDRLERRFGRYAIDNLIMYIVALNGLVYLLMYIEPTGSIVSRLALVPRLVLRGEVWRLFTYVFIPPSTSLLWIVFVLHFYYMIGTSLEYEWGAFKFNLYYFIGMLGTTIGAFISGGSATSVYLNLSLLLAFARLFPNFELLLFLILPVKVKYLAILNWIFLGWTVLTAPLSYKIAAVASVANYFVFFGKDILIDLKLGRQAYQKRRKFRGQLVTLKPTMHKCTVCGITENDDPDMEFRYCSKCDGDYEYCMTHLKNHDHIKEVRIEDEWREDK